MTDRVTLKYLAQQVIRMLSKGTPSKDSRLDEREIAESLRQELASSVYDKWYEAKKNKWETINPRLLSTFTLPVSIDTSEKANYVSVGVPYIHLPDGTGIWSVRPVTTKSAINKAMIPTRPQEMDVYHGTITKALEGQFSWFALDDRIYFTKRWGKTLLDEGVKNVLVTLVTVANENIGITDVLPISPEQRKTIVDATLQKYASLMGIMPDEVNDNSSVPR
ncbi:hypothetical protein AWW68_18800 [Roseivirga spongicola]|uniref:Uncharacterized protein n=1 Tax=Roseivirga spongicola TaxID=333140 RepID=A0A150XDV5_9BACT|nr:hypothetical protein [Roseivirga spongicola]KYG76907.1 hypothetical protein AWW68_18800 [Roseivirga spongicola]